MTLIAVFLDCFFFDCVPTALRFWTVVVLPEGFFCCLFDVVVVLLVEVFVLFALAFAGVVVVVRHCWFFFSAACVFDLGEDDFALGDTPREFVTCLLYTSDAADE